LDGQELRRTEATDQKAAAVHQDIAQVAPELKHARRFGSVRADGHKLPGVASDMQGVERRVEGDPARRGTHRAARYQPLAKRIDGHDRATPTQGDIHAPSSVFRKPPRFVTWLEGDGGQQPLLDEVDGVDLVAI